MEFTLHFRLGQSKTSQGPSVPTNLVGPTETIQYLKNLGKDHIDLILEFSRWVLLAAPQEGVKVMT
jgi:hypothetical protein